VKNSREFWEHLKFFDFLVSYNYYGESVIWLVQIHTQRMFMVIKFVHLCT